MFECRIQTFFFAFLCVLSDFAFKKNYAIQISATPLEEPMKEIRFAELARELGECECEAVHLL